MITNYSPAVRRAQWAADRQAVADEYFGGDTAAADRVMDALPYSCIPGWHDVRAVLDAATAWGPQTAPLAFLELDAALSGLGLTEHEKAQRLDQARCLAAGDVPNALVVWLCKVWATGRLTSEDLNALPRHGVALKFGPQQ